MIADISEIIEDSDLFIDSSPAKNGILEARLFRPVKLKTDFSSGSQKRRRNDSLTTSYFAVSENVRGTKIAIVRRKLMFVHTSYEWMPEFAPSDVLLSDYKQGLTWNRYVQRYLTEQRQHFKQKPEDFTDLLKRAQTENLVLCCYERFEGEQTHCHRIILYEILKKVAADIKINVNFMDETPYQKGK